METAQGCSILVLGSTAVHQDKSSDDCTCSCSLVAWSLLLAHSLLLSSADQSFNLRCEERLGRHSKCQQAQKKDKLWFSLYNLDFQ